MAAEVHLVCQMDAGCRGRGAIAVNKGAWPTP